MADGRVETVCIMCTVGELPMNAAAAASAVLAVCRRVPPEHVRLFLCPPHRQGHDHATEKGSALLSFVAESIAEAMRTKGS